MTEAREKQSDIARRVMRSQPTAVLSTVLDDTGAPYGSLVLVSTDYRGQPVMLLSTLAVHTQNILRDDRVCLVFDDTVGLADRLTGARVSVTGRATRTEDENLAARYIARHPSAAMYRGFQDFAFYHVTVERAHLVAGFGRIDWIDADNLLPEFADEAGLAAAEHGIVSHMNEDHSDAVALYANTLAGRSGAGWRMTGVDPEGMDLALAADTCRVSFEQPVSSAGEVKGALISLLQKARSVA